LKETTSLFDDTLAKAIPVDTLRSIWDNLIQTHGGLKEITSLKPFKLLSFDAVMASIQMDKNSLDLQLVFGENAKLSGLHIVPKPVAESFSIPPYAKSEDFTETDVVFGVDKWMLPGKISVPKDSSQGPFPCLVLVHGSGAHDEDETISLNKPFRDLAWGLASRGICVFRYVKRTKQHKLSPEEAESLTIFSEVVDDAVAAVDFVKTHSSVNPNQIFVLGHSLGGYASPLIGQRTLNSVNGFISLAGSTRPLEDLILSQLIHLKTDETALSGIRKAVEKIKSEDLSSATSKSQLLNIHPNYWLSLRNYDPIEVAREIPQSMLILQGDRDYQVTSADYERWLSLFADYPERVSVKQYAKLNHLMMEPPGIDLSEKSPSEYHIATNVQEEVIVDIAAWIKTITAPKC